MKGGESDSREGDLGEQSKVGKLKGNNTVIHDGESGTCEGETV